MAVNFCVECGAPRASGSVCPLCGTAYVGSVSDAPAPRRNQVTRSASASASPAGMNRQQQQQQQQLHTPASKLPATDFLRRSADSDGSSVDSYDFSNSGSGANAHLRRTQSTPLQSYSTSSSVAGAPPRQTRGILAGRYADHPACDICKINFDVTKRRHQWYACAKVIMVTLLCMLERRA